MRSLPLLPVTTVGSGPRSPALLKALGRKRRGEMSAEQFDKIADDEVLAALGAQESAGVDLVTDGEQRRDNFYSFVSEKLDGVQLMSLAELLDVVEDKEGFARLLETLDVPAFSIRNPTCVGAIRRREPLVLGDYEFLRRHTDRPIKVTLPGPYLLTRAMWVKEVTQAVYPSKEDLAEDVVGVLREEVFALRDAGADVNPRIPAIESPAVIVERVIEILRQVPADRIFLNPDCGFGTFANRAMNSPEIAAGKLASLVEAAAILRRPSQAVRLGAF